MDIDGQEPGISNLLEHLYLDNNRELQQDFGPKVHEGPIRRRNVARHNFSARDGTTKRTEVSLLTTLCSHSETITGLAVSMITCSSSRRQMIKRSRYGILQDWNVMLQASQDIHMVNTMQGSNAFAS